MIGIPCDATREVIACLSPVDIKSVHQTCKEMRDITTGAVSQREYGEWLAKYDRRGFHNWMGARLWQLEVELKGLDDSYRAYKCRGKQGIGYTRANCHSDYLIFDKCIRMTNHRGWGYYFILLKGVMDSVADVDGIPIAIEGFPGSDNYYRREGVAKDTTLQISKGPTFTKEDLGVILGHLKRLHAICLEVVEAVRPIEHRHEIYATYPGKLKRVLTGITKRIEWLENIIAQ